jgi:DNA-binding response OmpR family regulator
MNKRVLIVDNDTEFLETRAERLEVHGYHVVQATSLDQAEAILDQQWVHVVIVDLRMRDDADEKDTGGLALAKLEAYRSIPKIILTRYPSYEYVREALGMDLTGLPPAVDFIAKQEGPEAMLRALEQAFARHVRINERLTIAWTALASFQHLAHLIEPEMHNSQLADRAAELEDLFRKLFYDNTQITIGRLFVQQAGRVIIEVFAYGDKQTDSQFVISCGRQPRIADELARYDQYAPQWTDASSTDKVRMVETSHLAAIVYRLIGCELEDTTTFRAFYRHAPASEVMASLERLFQTTLAPWHQKGRSHEPAGSPQQLYLGWLEVDELALAPDALERRAEAISREALAAGLARIDLSAHKLALHLPDDTIAAYPNPALLASARLPIGMAAMFGITNGSVSADTVVVDSTGRTWLIDFARAGRGPLLRDALVLETAIVLELLETTELTARHTLELRLLDVAGLDAPIAAEGLVPEMQQALSAVERVRSATAATAGRDMALYRIGLLCCAVKYILAYDPTVRYTRRQLVPYVHSLVRAAMLLDKLINASSQTTQVPEQALHGIWIDQANQEVWVEGRLVDLTPQEFKILAYLYERSSQLCTRTMILKEALDDPSETDTNAAQRLSIVDEASRLNTAMGRLRQKIEPDPERPQYIITMRGRGYKLVR